MINRFLASLPLLFMFRNSCIFWNRQLSSPRSLSLSLEIDLHLHDKWKIVARKCFVPAIIVFHAVLSSAKVPILISSAAEEDSRDWTANMKTIEARNFFSLFSGNNLNSRRDDEKLFPRLVLESAAYYYQVQRGLCGFLSTFLSFFPFDDFYRFDYRKERRGEVKPRRARSVAESNSNRTRKESLRRSLIKCRITDNWLAKGTRKRF